MNKQEAIEAIDTIDTLNINDIIAGQQVDMVIKNQVLDIVNKIHEPQKVVVPKFVAEWIEYCKLTNVSLYDALDFDEVSTLNYANAHRDENEILKWLASANNQETFARAWLDGYEIEQEKLYEVTVPGTSNYKNQRQHLVKQGKHWFFCGNDVNRFKYRFTKGQIEAAGFGWVFDCNGVKVVEVKND